MRTTRKVGGVALEVVKIGLGWHVGAKAMPCVKVDDVIARGQRVGQMPDDALGAHVHSSVCGRVVHICSDFIYIEEDDSCSTMTAKEMQTDSFEDMHCHGFVRIKADTHLEYIRAAGIVGCGGAGFPAHVKFATDLNGGTFILNAAECEPGLMHNMHALKNQAGIVLSGLKYAMDMVNAKQAVIAVKDKNKTYALEIAKLIKNEKNINIQFLPDIYPVGDERVIVREILGVTLEPGQLPSAASAMVSNVETVKRVHEAIELKKPVFIKDFTVAGRINGEPKVFLDEPVGYRVQKYVDAVGGTIEPRGEIVMGGAFTGKSGYPADVVTKTTGAILIAMPYPDHARKFGLLACECGGDEARLTEIAEKMGGEIVASAMCKRMVEVNGRYRCDEPGNCPGQAEKVLALKSAGADAVLIGSCED